MIEIAQAINTFGLPEGHVQPDDQLILTRGQLQEIIQAAIQPLLDRIEALDSLQARNSLCGDPEDQKNLLEIVEHQAQITQALNAKLAAFSEKIGAVESKIENLDEQTQLERAYDRQRIAKLETGTHANPGPKTASRIAKLKEVLKGRGGSSTFAQIQKDLGISPSQLSKLVSRLDKRIFEVWRRAGGKHGEKVLGLRARLFD
jgi:hypothetical protein